MKCPKCGSTNLLDPFFMNFKPNKKKGHNKDGQEVTESYVCKHCAECFEGIYELNYVGIVRHKSAKN